MAKPWEKYGQSAAEGPWSRYQEPEPSVAERVVAAGAALAPIVTPGAQAQPLMAALGKAGAAAGGMLEEAAGHLAEELGRRGVPPAAAAMAALPAAVTAEVLPKTDIEAALTLLPPGAPKESVRLLGGAAERFTPTFKRAVEAAASLKVTPTLAEIGNSKAFGALEARLEKLPYAGQMITAYKQRNLQALAEARNALMEKLAPAADRELLGAEAKEVLGGALDEAAAARGKALRTTRDKALARHGAPPGKEVGGTAIKQAAEAESQREYAQAKAYYDTVEEGIDPALNVDPGSGMRATAQKILQEELQKPAPTLGPKLMAKLRLVVAGPKRHIPAAASDALAGHPSAEPIDDIMALPEQVRKLLGTREGYTYGDLTAFRGDLRSLIYEDNPALAQGSAQKGMATPAGRAVGRLMDALDADIDAFAARLGGEVKRKSDIARAFYRGRYKKRFDTDLMRNLVKQDPSEVYDFITRRGSVEDARQLRRIVGESAWGKFQRQVFEDILGGEEVPQAAEVMRRLAGYDQGKLREFLSPQQYDQVRAFAKTAELPLFVESAIEKRLRGVLKRDARQVVPGIVAGDTALLRATKNIVGERGLDPYRRAVVENILGVADGEVKTPAKIAQEIGRYSDSYLSEMFKPEDLAQIRAIGDARGLLKGSDILAGNPAGTASAGAHTLLTAAASAAGGGTYWLLANPLAGAGATLFVSLSPAAVAKLYTSAPARRLMLEGFRISGKSVRAAEIASRLAAYAGVKFGRREGRPRDQYQ